jgi:hypothetical protein
MESGHRGGSGGFSFTSFIAMFAFLLCVPGGTGNSVY